MLQDPKHKLNPTPPSPSPDQLRRAERGLQTQQIEAILSRCVDNHEGHRPIGGACGPQLYVAYMRLPGVLPPRPRLTLDALVSFDLAPIGQGKDIGLFALNEHCAMMLTAHML